MSTITSTPPTALQSAIRKARWRILPLICVLYFIAYLDRNNVGFARESMSAELDLTASAFGLGAGLFFIGYTLFEIPSNAGMHRFGARRWIARILIPWGLLAMGTAFVVDDTSFAVIRFLLGIAEAGFFPAVVFYFTLWFPVRERAAVLGVFVLAQPIANMIGAPLSGALLELDGVAGLHGWQWMYLIEGAPAVLFGLVVPFLLTDRPSAARWLAPDERVALETAIADDNTRVTSKNHNFLAALKDGRAWAYAFLNLGMVLGIYGLAFWLPSIVGEMGDFEPFQRSLVVAIPYAVGACFVLWWSRRADRTGKRAWHVAVSLSVAAIGLLGAGFTLTVSPVIAMASLSLAAIGIYTAIAPMLSMSASLFSGAAAAAGIGLVGAVGNVGGFISPVAVGWLTDLTGSTQAGILLLASALAITAFATWRFAGRRPEGDTSLALNKTEIDPTRTDTEE
ncbi:MFS transporter [Microbacterium sp. LWH12-1.2]|uniref:MFS transporter n=1 Tax=Microbacterium sp. LWH12-1.2 TaxID=3135259 RepID=UPI0034174795